MKIFLRLSQCNELFETYTEHYRTRFVLEFLNRHRYLFERLAGILQSISLVTKIFSTSLRSLRLQGQKQNIGKVLSCIFLL